MFGELCRSLPKLILERLVTYFIGDLLVLFSNRVGMKPFASEMEAQAACQQQLHGLHFKKLQQLCPKWRNGWRGIAATH